MASLEKIQKDILSLPKMEKIKLSKWLGELEHEIWDEEIEADFQEGGRGYDLLSQVKTDFESGKCSKCFHEQTMTNP